MIHHQTRDHVTVLRMEHGKANAVDTDLFRDLDRALDEVAASSARALVLTGSGGMFSAGVNLFKVLEGGASYLAALLPALSASVRRLFTHPLPIVAAVNGHAIAGGAVLAAACDRRVMNRDHGKIGVTELLVGVPFPVDAFEPLRCLLPERTLQELVYSGRTLGGEEAREVGLVEETAAAEAVLDQACEAARRMAAIPGDAFAVTKRQLRQPALERMRSLAPELDPEVLAIWSRPETMASIRAYLEQTVGKK